MSRVGYAVLVTVVLIIAFIITDLVKTFEAKQLSREQEILLKAKELEEVYHEKIKSLPDCLYDPSDYNRLFNN